MWPLSIFNSCLDNRVFNVKYLYIDDPFKLIHSCPIKLFSSLFPSSCFPFLPQRKMDHVGIGHFLPLRPEEGKTWSMSCWTYSTRVWQSKWWKFQDSSYITVYMWVSVHVYNATWRSLSWMEFGKWMNEEDNWASGGVEDRVLVVNCSISHDVVTFERRVECLLPPLSTVASRLLQTAPSRLPPAGEQKLWNRSWHEPTWNMRESVKW